jgi:hypothetical protein
MFISLFQEIWQRNVYDTASVIEGDTTPLSIAPPYSVANDFHLTLCGVPVVPAASLVRLFEGECRIVRLVETIQNDMKLSVRLIESRISYGAKRSLSSVI